MPDLIEPSKTARAKCRRCGEKIEKGTLRFGERVENAFGDGEATLWFHIACAAEKRPDKLLGAFSSFDGQVPDRSELEIVCQAGIENPKLATVRRAEAAPTGRARCQSCREKIPKSSLRVAIEREDEMGMASVSFIHAGCAVEHLGSRGLLDKLRRMISNLSDEEIAQLESALATG